MNRLPAPNGSLIDRDRPLSFRFEGRTYEGFAGDSIASALAANDVWLLSRSFKYHRPRGLFSMANYDANALVQLPDEPNVPAELRPVVEGMDVRGQNYVGSLLRDRRRWLQHLSRFLPAGFYYRAFYKPLGAWRFWEPRIRDMAGLGAVDRDAPHGYFDKAYAFCDVAVVGGGAAGLAAATSAAASGAAVTLIDNASQLGGWQCFARPESAAEGSSQELARKLIEQVAAEPRITVMTGATVNGWFADHWLPIIQGNRLIKLRAKSTVVASGAMEQPAVFRNNDLPGIMLGSAAQRLIRLYGVRPGRRAVVLTANGDGYGVALDLEEAGVAVAAVLDLREEAVDGPWRAEVERLGIPVHFGQTVYEAEAGNHGLHLKRVHLGRITSAGAEAGGETIDCDLLCLSIGAMPTAHLALQAGGRLVYDEALAGFRIGGAMPDLFTAGAVNGHMDVNAAALDGTRAGALAAAACGYRAAAAVAPPLQPYNHPYPVFPHPKGKDFVDFDEDQTVADILQAHEEGFEHVELLKRYTTIGMGPSQGRHSALNTARILARTRGETVDAVGVTTWRPPFSEERFGHLAGRGFHPARRTALHDRHLEMGAQMMPAGLWYRPAWYGDRIERDMAIAREVRAVRENVGLIDVSTLGGLEIRGPEAAAFMERMYTFAYARLPVGRTRYVLMCDRTGAIIDDGVACRLADDHFYVTATTGAVDQVYRQMLWWNAQWRMAVDIANVTAAWAGINIAGPRSRDVLARLGGDMELSAEAFPYLAVRSGTVAGIPARALRVGFVGELGYELHVPAGLAEGLWDALLDAGADLDIRPFGVEAQRVLRLEKGHVIVGQDTDGLTFPQEAGLGWAIATRKPHFVGKQAIAAQMQRGLNRQLVGFVLDEGAQMPEECHLTVRGDDITGRVTSIARSVALDQVIGLAYVAPDQTEPGARFQIKLSDASLVGATVTPLPFYDPENARQGL